METEADDSLDKGAEDLDSDQSAGEPDGSPDPSSADATGDSATPLPQPPKNKSKRAALKRFNIYLLLFLFIIVIALGVIGATFIASKHNSSPSPISSQSLTQSTLDQLANSDATVGSNNQVLNVQSSAVFAGKVLVRQDLEVAGSLQIGGTVALNGLAVSGTSQLGQVQINKDLAVAGNSSIQGTVTIAKSLQVNGSGTFSGPLSAPQITTSSLQLNSDLTLTHHIVAGGATPSHSGGSGLGSGGTASVSGSDTSGSVTINTGAGPAAGCFVTIDFVNKYDSTPHILLTPVGSSAGGLSYYVNRSSSSFSICDATAPPASASFGFDYFVVG
ncbi:MAG TPA: hypothetical protein VH234_04200 [Candidatus Saccharimonadales bacterium]|jgi:cytoskeletal protein CcmA (bactofilin family)|nr:hypothetical protein [Candidatus Saccharimonadales bacterium]